MLSLSKFATYAAWIGIAVAAAAARPAASQGFESMPGFGPGPGPQGDGCTCPGDGSFYSDNQPGLGPNAFDQPGFAPAPFDQPGAALPDAPANPFNEAYSFADDPDTLTAPQTLPANPGTGAFDQSYDPPVGIDEASLLVGVWAWEGQVEGVQARIQTAFYGDGTYESYAETPILDLYEAGYWALVDGVLSAQVVDYAPRFVDTPYGREPVPIEPFYETVLTFHDEDTVETDIGLSYRID